MEIECVTKLKMIFPLLFKICYCCNLSVETHSYLPMHDKHWMLKRFPQKSELNKFNARYAVKPVLPFLVH